MRSQQHWGAGEKKGREWRGRFENKGLNAWGEVQKTKKWEGSNKTKRRIDEREVRKKREWDSKRELSRKKWWGERGSKENLERWISKKQMTGIPRRKKMDGTEGGSFKNKNKRGRRGFHKKLRGREEGVGGDSKKRAVRDEERGSFFHSTKEKGGFNKFQKTDKDDSKRKRREQKRKQWMGGFKQRHKGGGFQTKKRELQKTGGLKQWGGCKQKRVEGIEKKVVHNMGGRFFFFEKKRWGEVERRWGQHKKKRESDLSPLCFFFCTFFFLTKSKRKALLFYSIHFFFFFSFCAPLMSSPSLPLLFFLKKKKTFLIFWTTSVPPPSHLFSKWIMKNPCFFGTEAFFQFVRIKLTFFSMKNTSFVKNTFLFFRNYNPPLFCFFRKRTSPDFCLKYVKFFCTRKSFCEKCSCWNFFFFELLLELFSKMSPLCWTHQKNTIEKHF